jgi:hypothetical protein
VAIIKLLLFDFLILLCSFLLLSFACFRTQVVCIDLASWAYKGASSYHHT